jgi:hypothetical protein
MHAAWHLARRTLRDYSNKFSRHDFTLPQLFACLAVKEHQKKSYRQIEALLRDSPQWCLELGMKRVPDHNTLCRAAARLLREQRVRRLLDELAVCAAKARLLGLSSKPLALDSSMYESHHVSRHYERRKAQSRCKRKMRGISRRKQTVKGLPKLAVAVDCRSHLVLSLWTGRGLGSDSPHFEPLLFHARRRAPRRRFKVVADAGYDAEHNHELARHNMGLVSIMPATIGRTPASDDRIRTRWRRRMRKLLASKSSRRRCGYTQRWQAETVNSMMKRNLSSALRGKSDASRRRDLKLKVLVHDLMILHRRRRVETEHLSLLCWAEELRSSHHESEYLGSLLSGLAGL